MFFLSYIYFTVHRSLIFLKVLFLEQKVEVSKGYVRLFKKFSTVLNLLMVKVLVADMQSLKT